MGNENSKGKDQTRNGKIPEKHENGSANGLSATITSNGLEVKANGETVVQQNGGTLSLDLATPAPTEPDFVIVETDGQHVDAPVISEIIETAVQVVEVKKIKEKEKVPLFGKMFKKKAEPPAEVKSVQEKETPTEDQTDVSLPATDPQPESDSNGDEAATVTIAEHGEDFEYPHQKAETSTQTDKTSEADISTQTGESDDDATTTSEDPAEEVVVMEAAATEEHPVDESAVVIAEEAAEEIANKEPLDNQTAGIVIEEVVNVFENMVFRAERVEVTGNWEINNIKHTEQENVNGSEDTQPEIAAEPESNPNESIIGDIDIDAEDNNIEETVPLENSSSLPKVVADCIEAVFAVSESTDFAAVNTSEPSVDEVITEDNGEEAGDMSAGVVLIETAEPESNAVTLEAGEENGVPSLDEEPLTKVMETILAVVHEEPNPPPINQDMPEEQLSVPLATVILMKVEEELSLVIEDEPSEISWPEEEFSIVEALFNQLTIIDELPEDTLNSPDDEVKPESISEVTTDENAEVSEDVIADVGPERVEEAEQSPVIVKDDAEVIPEAAIDALSQEFEFSGISQEPAVHIIHLEEEVIAATTFVPLSGERKASLTTPEKPSETIAEEMNEEAIEALSNESEPVPESVEEDTTVPESSAEEEVTGVASSGAPVEEENEEDATTEALENILESVVEAISEKSEPCVSVKEELVQENIARAEVLLEDADQETDAPSEAAVEEPTDSNPEAMIHERDNSVVEENSEDSQIVPSDEGIEAVLEAIVEEIITEDIATECNLVTSEEVAPEIIAEGETEEKAGNESSVDSTDSTQSAEITPVTSTHMEDLLVRLQSACTSVVVESAYMLSGLNMSSLGYSITVTIHVTPKTEQ